MRDLSNENIIHIRKEDIEYIQFRKLLEYSDILNHAYSLKTYNNNFRTSKNGRTENEYLNSLHSYKKLCNSIGCNYNGIVKPIQTHTDIVRVVDKKVNENEPDINQKEYLDVDGLITDKKDITLSTTNADCILILLFDPVKKVVANVHSGWRGTFKKIAVNAAKKMINQYRCNPSDIICCMCPSIHKCHFEVDKDVRDLCASEFSYTGRLDDIIEEFETSDGKQKWRIDTIYINRIILEDIGLKSENIIDSGICSVCDSDYIYSYRVEKKGYGLDTALIGLKN